MLDRFRGVGVDYESDIRTVDSHAEGYGRDDNIDPLIHKIILYFSSDLGIEARVIGSARNSGLGERFRQPVDLLSGLGVDDPTLTGMCANDAQDLAGLVVSGKSSVDEVWPIGMADKRSGIAQAELDSDILLHGQGGGCSERESRNGGKERKERFEAPVFRPEFVAPVGNAMRLVNCDQPEPWPEFLEKIPRDEPFGACIEKIEPAAHQLGVRPPTD